MRIRVVVKGKSNVLKAHNPNRYKTPIEQTVEKHTRLQANQASNRAPILHGPLSESIPASVKMVVGENYWYVWISSYLRGRNLRTKPKRFYA